jgi:hypothetical protein
MATTDALIVFRCRTGQTEAVALQSAVGIVQARGRVRLRRLDADENAPTGPEADTLRRMRREYVPPAERDVAWAGLLVVVDDGSGPTAPEWTRWLAGLGDGGTSGRIRGKTAAVISEDDGAAHALAQRLATAGFHLLHRSDEEQPGEFTRRIAGETPE